MNKIRKYFLAKSVQCQQSHPYSRMRREYLAAAASLQTFPLAARTKSFWYLVLQSLFLLQMLQTGSVMLDYQLRRSVWKYNTAYFIGTGAASSMKIGPRHSDINLIITFRRERYHKDVVLAPAAMLKPALLCPTTKLIRISSSSTY